LPRKFSACLLHVADIHRVEDRPVIVNVESQYGPLLGHVDGRLTDGVA
jgi:hypothetical protein